MLSIPIISEFNGKGIQKAIKQFKQLETTGQKAGFILKKAGQAAAVGFAGLATAAVAAGAALWSFAKDAMADQKSQRQLAASIKAVTKATDAQIKATEEWISKTQLALGVEDVDLRRGLARLVRSTKDTTKAQKLLNIALDISGATGKDLETVVNTLGRAMDAKRMKTIRLADGHDALGKKIKRTAQVMTENNVALAKLGLGFTKAQLSTMSFDEIMTEVNKKFGGSAARNAATFEGKLASLKQTFGELKESLGTIVLDYLERLADWGTQLGTIIGKEGLAGAVDYLVNSLKQLTFYDQAGKLNAFGKTMNTLARTWNIISRSAGVTGGLMLQATPFSQTGKQVIGRSVFGNEGTMGTLAPTFKGAPLGTDIYGGLPRVVINFNGVVGDPVAAGRQVRSVLDKYERRTGGR